MGQARLWISVGCALVLLLAGAVLGAAVAGRTRRVVDCATAAAPAADTATAGPDDILLTEQPWDGQVSAHVGQRLVIVLANAGFGGWAAVRVDGSAAGLVAVVGTYDYRCQERPPAAELAIVRAETPGVATVTSGTDLACRHVRPPCGMPQRTWRRTVTVVAG
jgi:hypothetical protein